MEIKMNLKQAGVLAIAAMAALSVQARGGKRLSEYVNPFIGATTNTQMAKAEHGLGKTFPGVATPWGMTQVSPNTITGGDNGSGYSYEHTTIEGFALTQMSGIGWYGDLGNYLVMPTTGPLHTYRGEAERPEEGYRSRYDKESETARAGYYAVRLTDYDIRAELTNVRAFKSTWPAVWAVRLSGSTWSVWMTMLSADGCVARPTEAVGATGEGRPIIRSTFTPVSASRWSVTAYGRPSFLRVWGASWKT